MGSASSFLGFLGKKRESGEEGEGEGQKGRRGELAGSTLLSDVEATMWSSSGERAVRLRGMERRVAEGRGWVVEGI